MLTKDRFLSQKSSGWIHWRRKCVSVRKNGGYPAYGKAFPCTGPFPSTRIIRTSVSCESNAWWRSSRFHPTSWKLGCTSLWKDCRDQCYACLPRSCQFVQYSSWKGDSSWKQDGHFRNTTIRYYKRIQRQSSKIGYHYACSQVCRSMQWFRVDTKGIKIPYNIYSISFAVFLVSRPERDDDCEVGLAGSLLELIKVESDDENLYRALVALGTLVNFTNVCACRYHSKLFRLWNRWCGRNLAEK